MTPVVAPDVLLIQPPIEDFYLTRQRTAPYGLECLAAALIEQGLTVQLLDGLAASRSRVIALPAEMRYLTPLYGRADRSPFALFSDYRHFGSSFDHLGRLAAASGAPLVGIASLCSAYADQALRTAEAVKTHHPTCKVVLGGHHPTALPALVMACPAVDFVIRGEGERALPRLALALRAGAGAELATIPGLVQRSGPGASLQIAPPTHLERLDDAPPPPAPQPGRGPGGRGGRGGRGRRGRAMVVASRGCPLRCSYCSTGARSSLPYRRRSVAAVVREVERQVQRGVGLIDFEDENLSLQRSWFKQLLDELAPRLAGRRVELRAMSGLLPHTLDAKLVGLMRRAGFSTLNLSLGSFDADQLRRFGRPDERAAFDRVLDLAAASGLSAVGYVIAAAPGQDPASSVNDLIELARRRVLAGVSIYYPAPGSLDHARCAARGLLPAELSLLRSTALPVSDRTSRAAAVTIWRLARVLNFIKALVDRGEDVRAGWAAPGTPPDPTDRLAAGRALLARFLRDGTLCGITPAGEVFPHVVVPELCQQFITGLRSGGLQGTV